MEATEAADSVMDSVRRSSGGSSAVSLEMRFSHTEEAATEADMEDIRRMEGILHMDIPHTAIIRRTHLTAIGDT